MVDIILSCYSKSERLIQIKGSVQQVHPKFIKQL